MASAKSKCGNFLSAVREYVDAFAHTLSSDFGEDAKLLFESEKTRCYEANLSYRFVDQLRNYCQHRSTPFHNIRAYTVDGGKQVGLFAKTEVLLSDKKFKKRT